MRSLRDTKHHHAVRGHSHRVFRPVQLQIAVSPELSRVRVRLRYSSSVMPPLPISSMSGSFQCPGAAHAASSACENPILVIESQVSRMSPVVRQALLLTSGPHFHTSSRPY